MAASGRTGKKLLLIMPPFWDTIAPSMGILTLRSFLQQYGHRVRVENLNAVPEVWAIQNAYFKLLGEHVPKGLVPRMGSELLGYHVTAALFKQEDPRKYKEYIKTLLRDEQLFHLAGLPAATLDGLADALDLTVEKYFAMLADLLPPLLAGDEDYVGCTMLSSTLGSSLFLLREAKRLRPGVRTLLGGPGPYNGVSMASENMARLARRCDFVDSIIFGEGELVLKALLDHGHEGDKIVSAKTLGLSPLDLDTLPFIDYSGLPLRSFFNIGLGTSRGCPFQCAFCSETTMWGAFRKMSPGRITAEIAHQLRALDRNKFFLSDALFNHSIMPVTQSLIEQDLRIEFDCYLRVDAHAQQPAIARQWREGGLGRARLGMESASPDILKVMQKGITPDQQAKALESLSGAGVRTTTYWIVGHPHETEQDFQETLDFITRNKDNIYEADLAVFYFFGEGEKEADAFTAEFGGVTERFPAEFEPFSLFKYFKLVSPSPSREEALDRGQRFVARMQALDVPCNRSSAIDYLVAETRWRKRVARN